MDGHARRLIPTPRPRQRAWQPPRLAWALLGRILWAHKLFLGCVVVSALALASAHVSRVPPVFEAETLLLLGEPKGPAVQPAAPSRPEGLVSEVPAFRSPAMAERLADALSLHLLPEFNPALRNETSGLRAWFDPARLVPNSLFNRLPAAWREALSADAALSDQERAAALRAAVAARTLSHITAELDERLSGIRVRFVSTDPALAALAANTLAELYLADRLAAQQAVSARAQEFLRGEIARLRGSIADAALRELAARVAPPGASSAAGVGQADRDLLATYRARLREISAAPQAQDAGARVISVATMPDEPVDPRRRLTFGAALFGALLVGSLAALGLERLDNTISSGGQLAHLGLATLGALPTIPAAADAIRPPDRHVLDEPGGPFVQAVAALRKELLRANVMVRRTSVLLVAALPEEGTTTTALCLARAHARAGGSALLLDCNMASPRLHALVGVPNEPGLSDVLLGRRTLAEVRRLDERSGAQIVAAGARVPEPGLLAAEAMRGLLRQAAEEHDLVLLDGPPVLGDQHACALVQMADCTLLVARWGSTRRQDVAAAAERLIAAGADMAGLVLTRVKPGLAAAET